MEKKIQRNNHSLKVLRRFNEDIWNILANKKRRTKNGIKTLKYICESYKNNMKYKKLLKKRKKRFFFNKYKKFTYQVITHEKEFRRPSRNLRIKYYLNKLKLRRFYGNISKKKFKRIFKESLLNSNFLGKSFICLLESRLDVLLYRANFFKSIFSARQYIFHQGIYVNGSLLYKPNYMIKLNTYVFMKNINYFYKIIKNKIKKKKLFCNYPAYLEINYKVGGMILYKIPSVKEVPFPFFLNYKNIAYSFLK